MRSSPYLWWNVELDAPDDDPLWLLSHGVPSPLDATRHLRLAATDGWNLHVTGAGASPRGFPDGLRRAAWAYGLVHNTLNDSAREQGWIRLHAALAEISGRGVVIAGPSGAGKTGLAVRLAAAGAAVHADEGVFARDGSVMGLPRRLHVKHTARADLPDRLFRNGIRLDYADPIWALDPAELSEVRAPFCRPPELLVLLGDRGQADLTVEWATPGEVVAGLVPDAAPFNQDRGALVREAVRLISQVPAVRIAGHHGGRGVQAVLDALG